MPRTVTASRGSIRQDDRDEEAEDVHGRGFGWSRAASATADGSRDTGFVRL